MPTTTIYDALDAIRRRWNTDYVDAGPQIPTFGDNDGRKEPETGKWARLTIQLPETDLKELGALKRTRHYGIMYVQFFDEAAIGDIALLNLIDTIKPAFQSVTTDGITWRSPSVRRIGLTGKWYQINLVCPFEFDEFHA